MAISILVADDHEVVRRGIASLLDGSDIEIIAEASDGDEAVELAASRAPDVVLMDIRMIQMDGLTALQRIRESSPAVPVIMLSTYDNPTYIARSVALGATDYLLKGSSREELVSAIQRAHRGEELPETSPLRKVRMAMEQRKSPRRDDVPLTNREMQVLRHVALGLSNKEIATSLEISVETVKEHVQNILRKLQSNDRTQAAVWAVKRNLI